MENDTTPNPIAATQNRITRISKAMALLCLLLMGLLPPGLALYWLIASPADLGFHAGLPALAIAQPLLAWQRGLGLGVTLLPLLMLLRGVWMARQCFQLFAQGDVFSTQTIRYLRLFAAWMASSIVARIAVGTALSVLLTWHNPPGMRQLVISIGSTELFSLFFAGMVWLIAAVIGQAQALAEENASFV